MFSGENVILTFVHSRTYTLLVPSNRRPCVTVNITLYSSCHDCAICQGVNWGREKWRTTRRWSLVGHSSCGPAECYTRSHKYAPMRLGYSQVPLLIVGVPRPEPVPQCLFSNSRGDRNIHTPCCKSRKRWIAPCALQSSSSPHLVLTQLPSIRSREEAEERLRLEGPTHQKLWVTLDYFPTLKLLLSVSPSVLFLRSPVLPRVNAHVALTWQVLLASFLISSGFRINRFFFSTYLRLIRKRKRGREGERERDAGWKKGRREKRDERVREGDKTW